jgi:hypothetical protein
MPDTATTDAATKTVGYWLPAYARAYAMKDDKNHETETRELLYSISSMNGRCQDLRDGYSMLKSLYKGSWLAENRPYWLDNVLVRYDLQIETGNVVATNSAR